jgi:hypothetical protein
MADKYLRGKEVRVVERKSPHRAKRAWTKPCRKKTPRPKNQWLCSDCKSDGVFSGVCSAY